MNNPRTTASRTMPRLHIDTEEILGHVAGARGTACRDCDAGTVTLIGDIAALLAEITWLYRSLMTTRRRAANLEAAICAALRAHDEGDTDALTYLRDEITPGSGGAYGA
jgi:hypothetical protein